MLSSANQRIEDTDFAKVMAEKVSLDIVQQAGVSVAMQAKEIAKVAYFFICMAQRQVDFVLHQAPP